MSNKSKIPGEQRNPYPCREIPDEIVGKVIAVHGWEVGVLFYMKEGEEGGMGVSCAGLGLRNGKVAQEFMRRILNAVAEEDSEAKEFKQTMDKELAEAQKEMSGGPEGGDPDTGKRLIMPAIERTREDHIVDRGPTGKAKKAWERLGGSPKKPI